MQAKDKLYWAKQFGDIMDASEPTEGKSEQKAPRVSINVNSPDNRIAGGDYIEFNIHVNPAPSTGADVGNGRGHQALDAEQSAAIQALVRSAIETWLPKGAMNSRHM